MKARSAANDQNSFPSVLHQSAVQIQSTWRGHHTRKTITDWVMKEFESIVREVEGKHSEIVWKSSSSHGLKIPQVQNTKLSEDESDLEKMLTSLMSSKKDNATVPAENKHGSTHIKQQTTSDNTTNIAETKHLPTNMSSSTNTSSPEIVIEATVQPSSANIAESKQQQTNLTTSTQSTQSSNTQTESPHLTTSSSSTSYLVEEATSKTSPLATKEQEIQTDSLLRSSINNISLQPTKIETNSVSTNTSMDVKSLKQSFSKSHENPFSRQEVNKSVEHGVNASSFHQDGDQEEFDSSIMCGLDMLKSFDFSEVNNLNNPTMSQSASFDDWPSEHAKETPQQQNLSLSSQSTQPPIGVHDSLNNNSFNNCASSPSSVKSSKQTTKSVNSKSILNHDEIEKEISILKLELARAEDAYLKRKKELIESYSQGRVR